MIALCPGEQYINFNVLQISSFHRREIEVFVPLKFYPALVDSFLPMFLIAYRSYIQGSNGPNLVA